MSERTEKQLSRGERPNVTPQPSRPALFDWVEDKFDGRESMPRYFELRLAFGPGGMNYRPEKIWQKEFKPNMKKPERDEMVELSNKFLSLAQDHCNEVGKPQGFVILAVNHVKDSQPYGMYYMKLRPTQFAPRDDGGPGGSGGGGGFDGSEEGIRSDATHRDALLGHSLEHQKSNDEHVRFMYDGMLKSWAGTFALQQEIVRELRTENQALKGQQLDWYKAMQEAYSTAEDRKMKADQHRVKMELLERGAGMLMQMIPVVAKSLEKKGTPGELPPAAPPGAPPAPIGPSSESIAIHAFNQGLSDEQKVALFGHINEQGQHVPGALTMQQVQIIAQVGECSAHPSALSLLYPGGAHAISMEQVGKMQEAVPMDQLMPLYAIMMESKRES